MDPRDDPSQSEEEETPSLVDDEEAALFLVDEEMSEEDREQPSELAEEEPEATEPAQRGVGENEQAHDSSSARIEAGPHQVTQGECLADIAFRAGHLAKTIWEHSKNAELRRKRKDPAFLLPGDTVYVPPIRTKSVSCATTKRHTFVRRGVPAKIELRPLLLGEPRKAMGFVLEVDGHRIEDKTDNEGWIKVAISPAARKGRLTLESGESLDVFFGHVDPVEEVTGCQARLGNLGYECALSGELDDETREVVQAFQEDHGLESTGELDAPTRAELVKLHGS